MTSIRGWRPFSRSADADQRQSSGLLLIAKILTKHFPGTIQLLVFFAEVAKKGVPLFARDFSVGHFDLLS